MFLVVWCARKSYFQLERKLDSPALSHSNSHSVFSEKDSDWKQYSACENLIYNYFPLGKRVDFLGLSWYHPLCTKTFESPLHQRILAAPSACLSFHWTMLRATTIPVITGTRTLGHDSLTIWTHSWGKFFHQLHWHHPHTKIVHLLVSFHSDSERSELK